jgi:hypothetical protein
MPVVVCSRKDCLNNGIVVCTANRIEWYSGRCSGYITSREAMKANVTPVERKNGIITQKHGRLVR